MAVVPTPQPTSSAFCPGRSWAKLKSSSVERRPPGWITRLPSTAKNVYGSNNLTSTSGRVSVAVISRPPFPHGDNWKTCCLPLRQPVLEPAGTKAGLLQDTDRLMRERAVWPAAVRHDFFIAREFAESSAEFGKRDRNCGWQVAGSEFFRWPDIQYDQVLSPLQTPKQLRSRDRLKTVACAEVRVGQLADLRALLGGHSAQVAPQVEHLRILEFVVDAGAVTPAANKADLTQDLQVLTGVRDGKPCLRCEPLDGAFAVGEDVDDLEAPAVCQRLP